MSAKPASDYDLQEAVNAYAQYGTKAEAARKLGWPPQTYNSRYNHAVARGFTVSGEIAKDKAESEQHRIKTLEAQLSAYKHDELNDKYIRTKIIGLASEPVAAPSWLVNQKLAKSSPGVPTLLCSDWHWGEVIKPDQIGGVNEYNLEIAHERAKQLILRTIDLLNNHMVNPKYPGIVMALAGDMVSGDIHDELKETNEIPLIPAAVDLFGVLIWCISTLADKFGKVFVPCVTGNHGRTTNKIRAKDRAYTSLDWLVYVLLEKHFANDKRITVHVPAGSDAYYRVYGHRYLLTHLDQFRGGDSMIGCLGPITRGDHKKRSRNMQVNMGYDTMIGGHWHQLIQLQRLIVNGSLCGYNEYAWQNNFPFEIPRQALWITHPDHGITFSMPVNVGERDIKKPDSPWISFK